MLFDLAALAVATSGTDNAKPSPAPAYVKEEDFKPYPSPFDRICPADADCTHLTSINAEATRKRRGSEKYRILRPPRRTPHPDPRAHLRRPPPIPRPTPLHLHPRQSSHRTRYPCGFHELESLAPLRRAIQPLPARLPPVSTRVTAKMGGDSALLAPGASPPKSPRALPQRRRQYPRRQRDGRDRK